MHVKPLRRFGADKGRHARRFRRDVRKSHPHNMAVRPMRGGWRL